MSNENQYSGEDHSQDHHRFIYFVNDVRYTSGKSPEKAAEILAKIPNLEPGMRLSVDGQHGHPDHIFKPDELVSLEREHGEDRHFTLVPPANFG